MPVRHHPPPGGGLRRAAPRRRACAGEAATTGHLAVAPIGADRLWNSDLTGRTVSAAGVDWPADLVFWNDASAGAVWDSDRGRRRSLCRVAGQAVRLRIGGGDAQPSNLRLGYSVVATAHLDTRGRGLDPWPGGSDDADGRIAGAARAAWGAVAVAEDALDPGDAEPLRAEGRHSWLNDGRAATVRVP